MGIPHAVLCGVNRMLTAWAVVAALLMASVVRLHFDRLGQCGRPATAWAVWPHAVRPPVGPRSRAVCHMWGGGVASGPPSVHVC